MLRGLRARLCHAFLVPTVSAKLKDFSRLSRTSYAVKVVMFGKRCKIDVVTTNR